MTSAQQAAAVEEMAHAQLGNALRVKRAVAVFATALQAPAGKITEVFAAADEREGAFRFMSNDAFETSAIQDAFAAGTARRTVGMPYVLVPVDPSSLSVTDHGKVKGTGVVGARQFGARGLKVISSIALSPTGTPLGLLSGKYWARHHRCNQVKGDHKKRPLAHKETRYWLQTMEDSCAALEGCARPWFQLDREGDFWELLKWTNQTNAWVTVRSKTDRLCVDGRRLSEVLAETRTAGSHIVHVPRHGHNPARVAHCHLRFAEVLILLRNQRTDERSVVPMWVVDVTEHHNTRGQPLHWRLLTSKPVETLADALLAVNGYTTRWRIEEFHKTWKSACGAEDTQLASFRALERWCTILAGVAMRIERLKYLARNQPEQPATVEFHRDEIDGLILLQKPKGFNLGDTPTIAQAVRWAADMGGYTGKSSGGPPGSLVIERGLARLTTVVWTMRAIRDKDKT